VTAQAPVQTAAPLVRTPVVVEKKEILKEKDLNVKLASVVKKEEVKPKANESKPEKKGTVNSFFKAVDKRKPVEEKKPETKPIKNEEKQEEPKKAKDVKQKDQKKTKQEEKEEKKSPKKSPKKASKSKKQEEESLDDQLEGIYLKNFLKLG
jgi:hypothetical protein